MNRSIYPSFLICHCVIMSTHLILSPQGWSCASIQSIQTRHLSLHLSVLFRFVVWPWWWLRPWLRWSHASSISVSIDRETTDHRFYHTQVHDFRPVKSPSLITQSNYSLIDFIIRRYMTFRTVKSPSLIDESSIITQSNFPLKLFAHISSSLRILSRGCDLTSNVSVKSVTEGRSWMKTRSWGCTSWNAFPCTCTLGIAPSTPPPLSLFSPALSVFS